MNHLHVPMGLQMRIVRIKLGSTMVCHCTSLPPQKAALPRRIDSAELLAGAQEIEIVHQGQVYRLRRTHSGKLILTK
jgi:hemin uptake protein HemP